MRDAVLVRSHVGLGRFYFERVIRQREKRGVLFLFDRNDNGPVANPLRYKDQQQQSTMAWVIRESHAASRWRYVDDNVIFFRQISREKMQTQLCRRDLHRHFYCSTTGPLPDALFLPLQG